MRQITIQVGWPGGIAWWRPFLDSAPRGLGQLSYLRHIKMQGACREAIWTETKTCSIQNRQGIDYQPNPANSSRVLTFRYVNFFKNYNIYLMPPRSKRCPNNASTVLLRNESSPWPTVASNRTKVMLTTAKPSPALAQQKPVNQADYHCGSSINWFLLFSIFLRSAWTLQKRLQVVQELLVSGRVLGASAHQYWPFDMQKGTW